MGRRGVWRGLAVLAAVLALAGLPGCRGEALHPCPRAVLGRAAALARRDVLPRGEAGSFWLLGMRWLEQEGGLLIAVDYAGLDGAGEGFSGVQYYRWRRWGGSLERLESRTQRGLAQVQLAASLDSRAWTPGRDPEDLEGCFSLEE